VDYILFRNYLQRERDQIARDAQQMTEMAPLIPFANSLIALEEDRRRMIPIDPQKTAATLTSVVKAIEVARRSNSGADVKVKSTVANRAAIGLVGIRNTLRDWYNFYSGYDPVFTWWVSQPYRDVDQAIDTYARFVRERLAGIRTTGSIPTSGGGGGGGRGGRGGGGRRRNRACSGTTHDDSEYTAIGQHRRYRRRSSGARRRCCTTSTTT
jgi:hypothetical protein